MKLDILVKKLKTTKWWTEEAPACYFLFDYIMKTFVSAEKIVGYPTLREIFVISEDNIGLEITSYDEKKNNFLRVYEKELRRRGYFIKLLSGWDKFRRDLLVMNKIAIDRVKDFPRADLIKFAKKFFATSFNSVIYGAFIECVDPFTEGLADYFRGKYKLSISEAQEVISILSTPSERSFLTEEKIYFYKLCLGKISVGDYLEKFYWINSNYRESIDLGLVLLKKKVSQELKTKGRAGVRRELRETLGKEKKLVVDQKIIYKKIKLDKKDKVLFELLRQFARHIDIRKESMLQNTYARDKFLKNICGRTPYSLRNLRAMRNDEILKVLAGGKVNLREIGMRHKLSVIYYTPKTGTIYYGKAAQKLYDAYLSQFASKEIRGTVVSGLGEIIKGKVSRVMDVRRDKFTPGTILVTSMTRPEFMPLVRQAKALVTDEGGLTCHAAIVSRELGIPCIVGTKNATRVLKSGDLVEVDANKGVVRKIK